MITIKAKVENNSHVMLKISIEGNGEDVFAEAVSILTRFPQELKKANPEMLSDALKASKAVLIKELLSGESYAEEVEIDSIKQ